MSEFGGGKVKVRCVDCTHLSGRHCGLKDAKVSPKKHRTCGVYNFKGEYVNRTSPPAMYIPNLDKYTQRTIRKLVQANIFPVAEDGRGFKRIEMPRSTATAGVLTTGDPRGPEGQEILPPTEGQDEQDSSGS